MRLNHDPVPSSPWRQDLTPILRNEKLLKSAKSTSISLHTVLESSELKNRGRKNYYKKKAVPWTAEEDARLLACVQKHSS